MSVERRVRGQQTGPRHAGLVLAVAGSETGVGSALTAGLLARPEVAQVRPLTPGDEQTDLLAADAVVVPPDVGPTRAAHLLATAAQAADLSDAARVVVITSAEVYGALPDNPVPLLEEAPLSARPTSRRLMDLLQVEALAARAALEHPRLGVTVLRPAALVGRGVASPLAGHFAAPRVLVVRGAEPRWQFCHLDDLVAAVLLASAGRVPGVATVACEGWLEQGEVEGLTGLRRVELPAALAFTAAERLRRFGVAPAIATDLAYLVHPWVVSSARLRALGWRAEHDNAEVLRELLRAGASEEASGLPWSRDATLASAGAAVAVVGTAALVRAARRRRRT